MGLLKQIVVGWEHIEPVFLGCVACEQHIMLRGKHGAGKTAVAKIISEALDNEFRHFNAAIAGILTVMGVFNPKALSDEKNPRIEYAKHDQTIWEAKSILIDELSRAPKESQNMWLSALEEKMMQGKKLKYETLIATMNPSTYAATNRVDAALFDRFTAVVDIPDIIRAKNGRQNILDMLEMTRKGKSKRDPKAVKRLGEALVQIKVLFKEFVNNEELIDATDNYIADFLIELANSCDVYVSARKIDQLRACIYSTTAYFKTIKTFGYKVNAPDGLFAHGANFAVMHVFGTALSIPIKTIIACHTKASKRLKGLSGSFADKIKQELLSKKSLNDRIAFLVKNIDKVITFPPAEMYSTINIAYSDKLQNDINANGVNKNKILKDTSTVIDAMKPLLKKMSLSKNPLSQASAKTISGELLNIYIQQLNDYMQNNDYLKNADKNTLYSTHCNYNKIAKKEADNALTVLLKQGFVGQTAVELTTKFINLFESTLNNVINNSTN